MFSAGPVGDSAGPPRQDGLGRSRTWRTAYLLGAVLLVTALSAGGVLYVGRTHQGPGNARITGDLPHDASAPWPARASPSPSLDASAPPYITAVSKNQRYLVDQRGRPVLVRGDSPWSLMTDLTSEQMRTYFADRKRKGVNAVLVSLIGAVDNGGPRDDGATFDGILPFEEGDILSWNMPYWLRAHEGLQAAAENGITVMLYPIDAWTVGRSLEPANIEQCRSYGAKVATFFADLPNIVWMAGGDYLPDVKGDAPSDVDSCVDQMMRGVRSAGDRRLFSIQLGYGSPTLSTDFPYWTRRVDWNFVYSYGPTYAAVLRARAHEPALPAVLGEANYEGENNQPDSPSTTDETLRRQVCWALTSGAAGDFYGSDDWEFRPGWEARLDAPGLIELSRIRAFFASVDWWRLEPDRESERNPFLLTGRGATWAGADAKTDVLDNDKATAAITGDGRLAVIYIPTSRTITIDPRRLAPNSRAAWLDPSTATMTPTSTRSKYGTPGANADGDHDWLLVFSVK